jgi:hypothetical protein
MLLPSPFSPRLGGLICSASSELLDQLMKDRKSAIERHHLFPKGCVARLSIKELHDTNQIANDAVVE